MATLKDVAKEAGVNVSTVSKALSGRDDINKETAARIRSIAKKIGYPYERRNQKRSGVIGVLCPEVVSNYYSNILEGIETRLKKKGYSLFVGFSNYDASNEELYLKRFSAAKVDGILYISENMNMEDVLLNVKNIEIPVTVIAQYGETKIFDCIKIDDEYGVRLAVGHIISKGHRDICYVGDELCKTREEIFSLVLMESNIKIYKKRIYTGKERFEQCGYSGMSEILSSKPYPTAVFAAYDDIAIGAIKAIYEKGLHIPDDISIAAIDNIRISRFLHPGLTTVTSPLDEMASVALAILLNRIESGEHKPTQNIKLNPELIVRESVRNL